MIELGRPDYQDKMITATGVNPDIIYALNSHFQKAVEQSKDVRFSGRDGLTIGRAIYNYVRNNVRYVKDPAGKQIIKLPARLIRDIKHGDCKSMALASAAFMAVNGFKNVRFRYASYDPKDPTPSHVYAVGTYNGRQIIIDPVYRLFNQEVPYKHYKDYPMEISVLSGMPTRNSGMVLRNVNNSPARVSADDRLYRLLENLPQGGFRYNVVANAITRRKGNVNFPRYTPDQLNIYRRRLEMIRPQIKTQLLASLVDAEISLLSNGSFTGNVITQYSADIRGIYGDIGFLKLKKIKKALKKISFKNIFKGVKTVGLVIPRKSFLALVALNFRGLAKRLTQLSDSDLKSLWVDKFGGKLSVLKSAINNGKNKKPLFGASKKVKAIKGIGVIIDEGDNTIGGPPVAAAAIIASAAPILVAIIRKLKGKGIPEVPESGASAESGDFPEAEGLARDTQPGLMDYFNQAVGLAKETGIIPDPVKTGRDNQIDQAIPGDDHQDNFAEGDGSGFKVNPLLLVGAGVGAYLLLRKK
jgi:hypothetical protein